MADSHPSSGLTNAQFFDVTAKVLAHVEACIDAWLQADRIDIDAMRTGGLLELKFPNGGTIVINTQPPLHELWLASPSGGYHFRHTDGAWKDTKSGDDFLQVLSATASAMSGQHLHF